MKTIQKRQKGHRAAAAIAVVKVIVRVHHRMMKVVHRVLHPVTHHPPLLTTHRLHQKVNKLYDTRLPQYSINI